jgi:hypothetical protein
MASTVEPLQVCFAFSVVVESMVMAGQTMVGHPRGMLLNYIFRLFLVSAVIF